MKKLLLWIVVLLLSISMVAAFSFAGCKAEEEAVEEAAAEEEAVEEVAAPTEEEEAAPKEPQPFKLGLPWYTISAPILTAVVNNVKNVCAAANGELVTDAGERTPDGMIASVENLITMGVDGILIMPVADSILPRIQQMCEEAQIPWVISFRSILDPDIRQDVLSSPYYLGNFWEDEFDGGFQVMKRLAELGVKNVGLLGLPKGNTTGDTRERGIMMACEKFGAKILVEARGLASGADATKAVESFITAYPELDGIFIVGGAVTPGILEAVINGLERHDKAGEVKVGMIDFSPGMGAVLDKGYLHAICGGHAIIDPTLAAALAVNKIIGTPLSDEPISVSVNFLYLKSAEEAENYYKLVESVDTLLYTEEEIRNTMIKFYNPDVTAATFEEIALSFNLDAVIERKGL